jgi:thioesterase domain-containing protein/acyl carrier protein
LEETLIAKQLMNNTEEPRRQTSTVDSFSLPLWFPQQREWITDPRGSDSAIYNYPIAVRLRGTLDRSALQRSLDEIVVRHQVLRSVFSCNGAGIIQTVVAPRAVELLVTELWGQSAEQQAREVARQHALQPFDLTRDLLLRAELLVFGQDDHVLLLTTHHLVYDDWSTGILTRELSALYSEFSAGRPSPLAPVVFQYGDFVRHQEPQWRGTGLAERLTFWRGLVEEDAAGHYLATDRQRAQRRTFQGRNESVDLPEELLKSLKAVAQRERVSLFMVLMAAFQWVIHSYSGARAVTLGTCVANRPLLEVEGLIGRFGNDIAVRTSMAGAPSFRELLLRVRDASVAAYSNQDLPFGRVIEEIKPPVEAGCSPFFQVMFILQNAPKNEWQIPKLTVEPFPLGLGTAKYDLILWLRLGERLEMTAEYNTDLFVSETMRALLRDYEAALRAAVESVETRISDLKVERRQTVPRPAETVPAARACAAPLDEVEARLIELWEAVLGVTGIGVSDHYFEVGGDSLRAVSLLAAIEKTFNVQLPLAIFLLAPTVAELARIIRARESADSWSSLVPVQPYGLRPPLFCVHGHYGQVLFCYPLSQRLGADQPVYGLQSQGLVGSKPRFGTVEEMAAHYLQEIRSIQPRGPYFLAGYCLGGTIAFEMARRLTQEAEQVALVAMFNTPSPGSLKRTLWQQIPHFLDRTSYYTRRLRAMGGRERIAYLARKARGLGHVIPGRIRRASWWLASRFTSRKADLANPILSVADMNFLALTRYQPSSSYPGRITLFLTEEAASLYAVDPRDGWAALSGGIEVHDVPGDNQSMVQEPHVGILAERLRSSIDSANRKADTGVPA